MLEGCLRHGGNKMKSRNEFEKALAEALNYILLNPVLYFSESDIHSIVYTKLSKILPELISPFDTNLTIGVNQYGEVSKNKYKTCCMHREYGINGIDYARSDLVIFNEDDLKEINDPINLKIGKGKNAYLTPDFILEFGTEKSAGGVNDFETHILGDINKAKCSKKCGYIVHIQRVYNKENNLEKYNDYKNIINSIFNFQNKIKILFFIVSIGSDAIKIFGQGKVKMYSSENKQIKGVNKNNYIDSIVQELVAQEKFF